MEHDDAANGQAPGALELGEGSLLGARGGQFVAHALSTHGPAEAIEQVQQRGALRDPECEPLLGLLDQIGQSRAEVYHAMLGAALAMLRERIPRMTQGTLLKLLEASFPFIGIEEVREVPLAVLDMLHPVPAAFLKQARMAALAADMELFRQLPCGVQRQVWELDGALFRRHVTPSLHGYAEETATIMRELDMSCRLTAIPGQTGAGAAEPASSGKLGGAPARLPPSLPRKSLRTASASIQRLLKLAGTSKRLYGAIVNLCRTQYAEHGGVAICSLRSQLLMALSDAQATSSAFKELCEPDKCYRVAALLDACVKDGHCDAKRLREILSIVEALEKGATTAAASAQKRVAKGGRGAAHAAGSENSDGGESISRAEDSAALWLADAGMVLRDPPVLHLLLHETVRTLEGVVEREAVPKDDPNLCALTKLLAYAVGTRELLLEHRHSVTLSRDVVEKFYPLLADVILEAQLRDSDDEAEAGEAAKADDKLVRLMQQDAVIRKVALAYILQRVTVGDLPSAEPLLLAAKEALTDVVWLDEGPFAASLARQLAPMCTAKKLLPQSSLWKAAVDGLLLRATAVSMEVHEEVLRLLLAAAGQMSGEHLAQCLETTLHISRRSRKHYKRRRAVIEYEYEPGSKPARARLPSDAGSAGYSSPGGYGSSGATGGYSSASDGATMTSHSKGATDGVRATYALIATKEAAKLNEQVAPKLFEYLRQQAA